MISSPEPNLMTDTRLRRNEAFIAWQVQPGAVTYPVEEFTGNAEAELCGENLERTLAAGKPVQSPAPEIEPEEFEKVYLWFLA